MRLHPYNIKARCVYFWRYGSAMEGEPSQVYLFKEYPTEAAAVEAFFGPDTDADTQQTESTTP